MRVLMLTQVLNFAGGTVKTSLQLLKHLNKNNSVEQITSVYIKEFYSNIKSANISAGIEVDRYKKNSIVNKLTNEQSPIRYLFILIFLYKAFLSRKMRNYEAIIVHDMLSLVLLNLINTSNVYVLWYINTQLPPRSLSYFKFNKNIFHNLFSYPFIKALSKVTKIGVYDSINQNKVVKHLHKAVTNFSNAADIEGYINLRINSKNKKNKTFTLLSVGILLPYRRYEDIILALKKLLRIKKDTKLVILGRSDFYPKYKTKLVNLITKERVSNKIEFIEYLSEEDKKRLYQNTDIFIFVNNGYTWGQAAAEAIAAEIPTILTNNIGLSEIVGSDGWIVKPNNPNDIYKLIKSILLNKKKSQKKAHFLSVKIRKKCSWSSFSYKIEEDLRFGIKSLSLNL